MGTGTDCALRVPSFVSATSSEDAVLQLIVRGQEAARCRGNVLLSFQSQGSPVPRAARLSQPLCHAAFHRITEALEADPCVLPPALWAPAESFASPTKMESISRTDISRLQ